MASIKKLFPGQVLWSIERRKMGNTTLISESLYEVVVESISEDGKSIMARWNGNPSRRWNERSVRKLKTIKPVIVSRGMMGSVRYGSARKGGAT